MEDFWGEPIYTYTRAQALADGVLCDLSAVSPVCREHYKYPIACTAEVWSLIQETLEQDGQDLNGILHDVLWMSRAAVIQKPDPSTVLFKVKIGPEWHTLKLLCGPGDQAEPVLTLMFPEQD